LNLIFFLFKKKTQNIQKTGGALARNRPPAQNFLLFKRVIELMNRKEHLTTGGLRKIVGIKAGASARCWLPEGRLNEFRIVRHINSSLPEIVPFPRPIVSLMPILDPQ
jgi:hypothetical protein